MPVITQMNDGRYITVFEASPDVAGHPLSSNIKFRRTASIGRFPSNDVRAQRQWQKRALRSSLSSPTVVLWLHSKQMKAAPTRGSFSSMFTMISSDNGASWQYKTNVFPVSDTKSSNWNALMAVDSTLVLQPSPAQLIRQTASICAWHTVTPTQTNLVNNPGFETANVAGWTTYGDDYPNRILIHGANDGVGLPAAEGSYFVGLAGTADLRPHMSDRRLAVLITARIRCEHACAAGARTAVSWK